MVTQKCHKVPERYTKKIPEDICREVPDVECHLELEEVEEPKLHRFNRGEENTSRPLERPSGGKISFVITCCRIF